MKSNTTIFLEKVTVNVFLRLLKEYEYVTCNKYTGNSKIPPNKSTYQTLFKTLTLIYAVFL